MKDKVIEIVKDKNNEYIIKENVNGFYAEVIPRNKFKLMRERISDYLGDTYIHPRFLDNWYYNRIDSVKWKIGIHTKLTNG